MPRTVTTRPRRRVNPASQTVNPENHANLVRGALVSKGSSLAAWGRAMGFHRTQVSKALHGRRTDARSRMIRAELMKLIGGN
jgi:hypothetical protein